MPQNNFLQKLVNILTLDKSFCKLEPYSLDYKEYGIDFFKILSFDHENTYLFKKSLDLLDVVVYNLIII